MVGKRVYDDGCGTAHALDLIGERWALLVVRELLLGPKRFTDLRHGLPGASAAVLSQRLRELEDAGVLTRRKLPPPAAAQVYELTPWGAELGPVILSLGLWASKSRTKRQGAPISADALVLSMRARYTGPPDFARTYELRFGEDRFVLRLADGELTAARGEADSADLVLDTCPGVLDEVISGIRPVADALGADDLRLKGSEHELERFVGMFG